MSSILALIVAATLLLAEPACAQAVPPTDDHFVDLGEQITATLIQGSTFTKDPTGNPIVCTVIRGQPAKLLVFDLAGKLLHRLPLEGGHGAWNACTATDGSVYVGTDDNGHLYRWIPGEESAKDLGQVGPDQTFAWDEEPGKDGEVFIGTYPGCNVYRYHPKDGFTDIGHGAVAPGENYARSVAFDSASGKIYVGVGSHAHLIELDPKTGAKKDILPPKYTKHEFCYTVNFVAGKLFALPTNPPEAIVMNPATYEIEATLPGVSPQQVVSPKSPVDDKIYFCSDSQLSWYDLKTRKHQIVKSHDAMNILAMIWIDGNKLAIVARPGRVAIYDPATGKFTSTKLEVPPEPTPIHYIRRGPDGKIYCGGYLSGGLSAYDPATKMHEQLGSISQAEGIGVLGNRLYFGVYPHARLAWFDTSKPWNPKAQNPHEFDHLDRVEQDRPFGVLGVESLGKIFYGTVPDYGKLGGVLAVVDAKTDAVTVHRNIIPDQSIVSLVWANDLVVGGTSTAGGLGIEPKTKEGKLFLWDSVKNEVVFQTVPVPGATLITGLVVGPDNNVWGIADGVLFIFDVPARKVTYTKKLFDVDAKSRHANWRDAIMLMHPAGQIYGTTSNKLFRLDPETKAATVLRDHDSSLLAIDRVGRIYFRDNTHLWQYKP